MRRRRSTRRLLLALALARAGSAHALCGVRVTTRRAAARMVAAVDGAPSLRWDLDLEVEGAEGASACHAVFAQLAASEEFARETWARKLGPLLASLREDGFIVSVEESPGP